MLFDAAATVDPGDLEVLYHTIEFPDPACLRLLLERGNTPLEQIKYCLGRATDFEYPQHIALLLHAGADPNFRIKWDGERTHLHKAVYLDRSIEIIRMLIDAGGDVNAVDERGISVLRSAVRNGNAQVIALLRSHGAHDDGVSEADAQRGDPMTLCLAAGRDDLATIDRLLDGGADVNAPAAPIRRPRCTGRRGAGGSTPYAGSSNAAPTSIGSTLTAAPRWGRRSMARQIASTPKAAPACVCPRKRCPANIRGSSNT